VGVETATPASAGEDFVGDIKAHADKGGLAFQVLVSNGSFRHLVNVPQTGY
jgi:hypothetical protein